MEAVKKSKFFYGWNIVIVASLTMFMVYGIRLSFSVFYVAIMEDFGWSRAGTAAMFSINMIVYGLSSAIGGYLIDRFGGRKVLPAGGIVLGLTLIMMSQATAIWHFYLLYGFVMGLTLSSMGYVVYAAILSPWFSRLRGAAMGIAFTGSNVASLTTIFSQYLISSIGWRGGFQILGLTAIVVIVLPSAIFLRRRPEDIGLLPDGIGKSDDKRTEADSAENKRIVNHKWASTQWTLPKAVRTLPFWGLITEQFLISTAMNFVLVHQVAYCVDIGFSKMYAATIFGFAGIFGVLGVFGGALSDRLGREKTYTLGYLGLIFSLFILMLTRDASQPWWLWLFAVFYGLSRVATAPLYGAITADLFQGRNFGTIMGIINWGFGFGAAFGGWFAGYVFDLTRSYSSAFIIANIAHVLSITLTWLVIAPRRVRLVPGQVRSKRSSA